MGHCIDLIWLLGLPKYIRCPKCKELTSTDFDEYDIDCGEPQAIDGIMTLDVQCDHCESEIEFEVKVSYDKNNVVNEVD